MQKQFPAQKHKLHKFVPKKGQTVQPRKGQLVPSKVLTGWETGMIYNVAAGSDESADEVYIKGILKGVEFAFWEFSDNVELKPYD